MTESNQTPGWLEQPVFDDLNKALRTAILQSWADLEWIRNATGRDLFDLACADLKVQMDYPFADHETAVSLGDRQHRDLVTGLDALFAPGSGMAVTLADQIQLRRAFSDPTSITNKLKSLTIAAIKNFPSSENDLKRGKNPGDVLDPYLLSANFELLSNQELTKTIETTVSHKILMKIEDLVGNLHQTTIGEMRGNFRIPEPAGKKAEGKERLNPASNPFPGADVGQVPLPGSGKLRLFQVKSKTGSAKGGDGKRLGEQLKLLEDTYDADTFYAAVVGNTLKGHRSRGAVESQSSNTAILVGSSALNELTQSAVGSELLLRIYQRAFRAASQEEPFDFAKVASSISASLQAEADEAGDDFLTAWLHTAVNGSPQEQDSREQQN